ncbi:MAG: glycosyltransferase [Chlamydiota bacterium]
MNTDTDYDNLQYFQMLYERNRDFIFNEQEKARIPKIIHFIWVGNQPFPESSIENVKSWVDHHPDWKVVYWTDRRRPLPHPKMEVRLVSEFEFLKLRPCFDDSDNYGEQAALLLYEILYQEGGLYVDHDVECFQSFAPFHRLDFYCGVAPPDSILLGNSISICQAVVGAKPGHPIIKKSIELVRRYWNDIAPRYSGNNWKSVVHRVMYRTTLRFEEAVQLAGNQDGYRNITFPVGYFNKIDGDLGIYAHHKHAVAWLNYETRFEQCARRELYAIADKNNKILVFSAIILAANVLLIGALIMCYRFLRSILRDKGY